MGGGRGRSNRRGAASARLAPLFVGLLAGCVLTVIGLWRAGVLGGRPDPSAPPEDGGRPPALRTAAEPPARPRPEALAELLEPAARWRRRDMGPPLQWAGVIDEGESLMQWNARMTAGIEALGLEVVEGREEVLDRVQGGSRARLTLVIGSAGDVLATLAVDAVRSRSTPPAF